MNVDTAGFLKILQEMVVRCALRRLFPKLNLGSLRITHSKLQTLFWGQSDMALSRSQETELDVSHVWKLEAYGSICRNLQPDPWAINESGRIERLLEILRVSNS